MKKVICAILAILMLVSAASCGNSQKTKTPEEFTVKFDPNGGTIVSGEKKQTVEEGDSAKAPTVEREGYEFDGWDKKFDDITEDITVKAKWKQLFSITFVCEEDPTLTTTVQVAEGETPEAPELELDGYKLNGWEPEIVPADSDAEYKAVLEMIKVDAQKLYEIAAPCVAEITVYDKDGEPFAQGSGFFIDSNGLMATNYHVMEGAYTAKATTLSEKEYNILYVLDYDEEIDIALIRVDVTGNEYLKLSKDSPATGEKVFTIGSSLGLDGTLSDGIVSTASRVVEGNPYIQITAPISHGNSGGPLLDEYARVIGINTMGIEEGQNLNFAVPVSQLDTLSTEGRILMNDWWDMTYVAPNTVNTSDGFFKSVDEAYWEVEYNDSTTLADNIIVDKAYAAAIADGDDIDVFKIVIEQKCTIDLMMIPYKVSENDSFVYILCTKGSDELEVIVRSTDFDTASDDDLFLNYKTIELDKGTYYFAVSGESDAPLYYAVCWMNHEG